MSDTDAMPYVEWATGWLLHAACEHWADVRCPHPHIPTEPGRCPVMASLIDTNQRHWNLARHGRGWGGR